MPTTTDTHCPRCYRPQGNLEADPTGQSCGCHLPPHRYVSNPSGNKSCALCSRGGTAKIHRAVTA